MKKDFETLDKIMDEIDDLKTRVVNYETYIYQRALDKLKRIYGDKIHSARLVKIEHYLLKLSVCIIFFDNENEQYIEYIDLYYKED